MKERKLRLVKISYRRVTYIGGEKRERGAREDRTGIAREVTKYIEAVSKSETHHLIYRAYSVMIYMPLMASPVNINPITIARLVQACISGLCFSPLLSSSTSPGFV